MFERPQGGERAVLVSLDFGDADFRAKAAELRELALSAGLSVSATVEGRRQRPDPATFAGRGKVVEIAETAAAHGAELVTTILGDGALRKQWEGEVAQMRDRINGMRGLLVKTLHAKGVPGDYSFITRQRGMFSFSGLTPEHVKTLKEKYAIYIVGSGRINVAGITSDNVGPLCEAIAAVVK